jgi:hypothetical protein
MIGSASVANISKAGPKGEELHWLWLGLFVVVLVFLGGSSWSDPIHHVLLWPIAALMMIPALYRLRMEDIRRGWVVFLLLGASLTWLTVQLVPLPPSVWQTLPDRQVIAELDQLAGLGDIWRPISLTPFRGLNTAFGFLVPIVGVLLALATRISARALLIWVLGMGIFDAALVLLQVIGGSGSPFYLFPNPSAGAAEGIFANENHSAVFSAIAMLIITRLALEADSMNDPKWLRLSYVPAFLFVLLAVLVSGSRAGLAAALVALIASALMIWWAMRPAVAGIGRAAVVKSWRTPRTAVLASCATAAILLIAAFVWLQRTPAFADIMKADSFDDLRFSLWPILIEMASNHWLLGTGFGSFDAVYRSYEPTDLLLPSYVNQAHNDWAQLAIEGGLPAIVLLACFIGWLAKTILNLRGGPQALPGRIIFWGACIAIIAAASLVDYPLRTPIFQAVSIWLLLCLSADSAGRIRA